MLAYGRSDYEIERFGVENTALETSSVEAARVMGIFDPVMAFGMNLTIVLVVWLGGDMVNTVLPDGTSAFTVGQMMAFISYTTQILFALVRNGVLVNAIARSKASANRINQVMETVPQFSDPTEPLANRIADGRVEFKDVSFRYGKRRPCVTGRQFCG